MVRHHSLKKCLFENVDEVDLLKSDPPVGESSSESSTTWWIKGNGDDRNVVSVSVL